MMARAKRIHILMIKVNKLFPSFSSRYRCFLKGIKKTFFTFLSTYQVNILERNRGLTAVLETVTRIITGAVTLLHYSMVSLASDKKGKMKIS